MRKSSLVLMAIFCLLWAGLWFRPTPSLAVAKAQSGQISKNQTTTLQPHQYWLMPDLQPERAHLDQQFTVWLDALVPELMTAQRDGRLQAFTPVPELYAILLTQADAALLPQLAMRVGGQNMVVDTPVVVQQRIDALQTWHELSQSFQPDEAVPALADELRPSALLTSTLNSFTAYLDEAYVYGYLDTPNTLITLTLKTGAVVKSQVNTLSNGGNYFDAYFTAVIAGGDTIEVEMPGSATAVVTVAPLTLMSDKAADTLYGTAPANSSVYTWVFSEFEW